LSLERRKGPLLKRSEKRLLVVVTLVILVCAIINTILNSQGYRISLYVMTRDVAVMGIAGALIMGNLAAMRRNRREGILFLTILCLLVIVTTVHMYRLIYGGLPSH
jgi:peptidoglycan/LPS O-acetylase OafA/YrhL